MWRHVVIEGFCFGPEQEERICPCRRSYTSPFCLGDGSHEACPHFAWADTSEREAAQFVPLRLILRDRLLSFGESMYWKLHWWFWGKWRYDPDWIKRYPVAECPAWDKGQKEAEDKFPAWFKESSKGD